LLRQTPSPFKLRNNAQSFDVKVEIAWLIVVFTIYTRAMSLMAKEAV
jgi:hypothetical protein